MPSDLRFIRHGLHHRARQVRRGHARLHPRRRSGEGGRPLPCPGEAQPEGKGINFWIGKARLPAYTIMYSGQSCGTDNEMAFDGTAGATAAEVFQASYSSADVTKPRPGAIALTGVT